MRPGNKAALLDVGNRCVYWRNISAKIQKIFGKVMIWIDFIYQNGIEISLSSSFGDK